MQSVDQYVVVSALEFMAEYGISPTYYQSRAATYDAGTGALEQLFARFPTEARRFAVGFLPTDAVVGILASHGIEYTPEHLPRVFVRRAKIVAPAWAIAESVRNMPALLKYKFRAKKRQTTARYLTR